MTLTTDKNRNYLYFLDYLRVIAILIVIIAHQFRNFFINNLFFNKSFHPSLSIIGEVLKQITKAGGIGVMIFFIISGFIISYILQFETPKDFIIRRFFRIYPTFWCCVILFLILKLFYYHVDFHKTVLFKHPILTMSIFLNDFFEIPHFLKGVDWSLRVELLFYIFMFCVAIINTKIKYRLFYTFVAIIGSLLTIILYKIFPFPYNLWSKGYLFGYATFLFLGIMYYEHYNDKISDKYLYISIVIAYLIVTTLTVVPQAKSIRYMYIASIAIFHIFYANRNKIKYNLIIHFLASISYPMYLTHNWFVPFVRNILSKSIANSVLIDVLSLVLLILLSYGIHFCIEKPFIKIGKYICLKTHENTILPIKRN